VILLCGRCAAHELKESMSSAFSIASKLRLEVIRLTAKTYRHSQEVEAGLQRHIMDAPMPSRVSTAYLANGCVVIRTTVEYS
jgi:hypothetical protein